MWSPLAPPTGDLARNPGMYPDWESNQPPFGSQAQATPARAIFFLSSSQKWSSGHFCPPSSRATSWKEKGHPQPWQYGLVANATKLSVSSGNIRTLDLVLRNQVGSIWF